MVHPSVDKWAAQSAGLSVVQTVDKRVAPLADKRAVQTVALKAA